MATRTDDVEIASAVMYGWDNGGALARQELRPYIHHLDGCWAGEDAEPQNSRCNCGLRRVWRIQETADE